MRTPRTLLGTLAVLTAGLLLSAAPAFALQVYRFDYRLPGIGPLASGQMSGFTVDGSLSESDPSAGDIYVGDQNELSESQLQENNPSGNGGTRTIDKFSPSGSYISDILVPGLGNSAPAAIAVDPANGDLYVVNRISQSIEKFSPSGQPVAGYAVTGITFAFGENGGAAVDPVSGDLYVIDQGNSVVDRLTSSGAYVSQIAVESPSGVAVDADGNVYVSSTVAGTREFSSAGTPGPVIDTGSASSVTVNQSTQPNRVYVADLTDTHIFKSGFERYTSVIKEYSDSTGDFITQFGAERYGASGEGGGAEVSGLAVNNQTDEIYTRYTFEYTSVPLGYCEAGNPGATKEDEARYCEGLSALDAYGSSELAAVFTGASANLQATSVTLDGTVDPDALGDTSSQFEYGPTTAYGSMAPALQAPGAPSPGSGDDGEGESDIPVTVGLTNLESNTNYHYRLDALDANGTDEGLDQTFTTPPGPPVAESMSASDVESFSATLHGLVNPEHASNGTTTYHFEYGPTSSYGKTFEPDLNAGDGSAGIPVTEVLSGLAPGTTYHYALVASNPTTGTTTSPDQTFTTLPPPPLPGAITGNASAITQTSATISGTLDQQGLQTSAHFDIGPDTNYGTQVYAADTILAGPTVHTLTLENLQPATTYHYRLVATSVDGTSVGADATFTTLAVPSAIVQPVAPALLATPDIAFPTQTTASSTSPPKPKACKKGFLKQHGRCVKKPKRKQVKAKRTATTNRRAK